MASRRKKRKRLTRSASDRRLLGVLGGFAQYYGIKASYLRWTYVILTILTHVVPGAIIYLMMALAMPADPHTFSLASFLKGQTPSSQPQHRERKELHDVEEKDDV
ncbi:PspC domain-containing protein [Lactobacillus alvi]|uniref:PspC domain-containing protein n=1 Tax=Limosilactobacillus alvi TaxID=990412 RepID=A0ABS2ENP0_9LACO|nr:PspC domain-containing protein [Limosilactobacillus alvi]MBM6754033.1 PspC domain-containing protein [Limosilactobacillus alvi]